MGRFDLSTIHVNPDNPYPSKSDEEFQYLVAKIEKYPKFLKLRPIVYDPATMMILGGNKRFAALESLGFKSVPDEYVKSAEDLTEEEKKNFIYADNVNYGAYDFEMVDEEMAEEWGIEFPEEEEQQAEAQEDDFDTTPPTVAKTVLGDLYEIGSHRLLCGDKWTEFCKDIGDLSNLIVWDKGGGGIGDLKKTFSTDFEVALVYHRGAEIKGKRIGSVWSVGKDSAYKYQHPTQKPIELAATAISNILEAGLICLDLFLGSGSTMVAAHQLKRKCYGMELDEKYCDVIVKRMHKLDPTLTIKRNGKDISKEEWLTA